MSTSRTRRLFEVDPGLLVIEPWEDPTLAQYGFGVGDDYVEMFWLSTLGPTATWLLRRLVKILGDRPNATRLDVNELSASIGIGSPEDRLTPLIKSLDRLVMFGVAQARRDRIGVRLHVPPLASKQIDRLPPHLQRSHDAWMSGRRELDAPVIPRPATSRGVSAVGSAA
jgi:hypothetical protein